jgi:hypothetical protein
MQRRPSGLGFAKTGEQLGFKRSKPSMLGRGVLAEGRASCRSPHGL